MLSNFGIFFQKLIEFVTNFFQKNSEHWEVSHPKKKRLIQSSNQQELK
jgi:hypothetical protein